MNYPYYKLATQDARSFCFKDGKTAYPTEAAAKLAAGRANGVYRVSEVTRDGRTDGGAFEVTDAAPVATKTRTKYNPAANRPLSGFGH
jgi:hypothetical protein